MYHIVFICDENYFIPTKAAINSVIRNKNTEDKLHIAVIGVGLGKKHVEAFDKYQSASVQIEVIIPEGCFDELAIKHMYVSKAALYKMVLPKLLPEVDKVLYLDSDMLVLSSIQELFAMDVEAYYAAVVKDMIAELELKQHERKKVEQYFNSGMMLLNLKKMREEGIVQELIASRIRDTSNQFMDQNTFNEIFNKKILTLPPTYNYMQTINCYSNAKIAQYYGISEQEAEQTRNHPVVLHLTSKVKPWHIVEAENKELWFSYAELEDIILLTQKIADSYIEQYDKAKACIKFLHSQDKQNTEFALHGIQIHEQKFSLSEKMLYHNRIVLWNQIMSVAGNGTFIIYGAGKFAQFLFKCIYNLNKADMVEGFAVADENANLSMLYGKKVQSLDKFENKESCIVYAVKASDKQDILNMQEQGYRNIVDINDFLVQ